MKGFNAKNHALRLIELKPRSVQEIRDRLAKKGVEKAEIEAITAELEAIGLLDDVKFARDWIENRQHFRPMGVIRLRQELFAKGIDREIVEAVLSQYRSQVDEKSEAMALARKKLRTLQGLKPEAARRRLAGFLARRGFSTEAVALALRSISTKIKEDIP